MKVNSEIHDTTLLALFRDEPHRAWQIFTDRYADLIFTHLQTLGFDYDQTMDRFVYVCEKLCEQNFRRMKSIRRTGTYGDLTPWIKTVVNHLSVNWLWSKEGRKRLLKPIAALPSLEQRVFALYFWKGLSPSAICEHLRLEHHEVELFEVLDMLEKIFSLLSRKKLWRLMSNLMRAQKEVSLENVQESGSWEPADERVNPEEAMLEKEAAERMRQALDRLSTREKIVIQFRYEEGIGIKELAQILHWEENEVKALLRSALSRIKEATKLRVLKENVC